MSSVFHTPTTEYCLTLGLLLLFNDNLSLYKALKMGSMCYAVNIPCCYVCIKTLWIEADVQTSNFLNECTKNLKNGTCHFQIPVL